MKLNPNQLSAILDGLLFFEDSSDDYESADGKYTLTNKEFGDLIVMIEEELNSSETVDT